MSRTSGQFETDRPEWRDCDGCGWGGIVDVWYDPELRMTGWDCTGCNGSTFTPERES